MALDKQSVHESADKVAKPPGNSALADICRQADVVVGIGLEAAQAASQECTVPMLAVLITRQQANNLFKDSPRAVTSAIYLEADPVLNLRLLSRMLPGAKTVGVFVPLPSAAWLPEVRAEAQRLQLRLDEIEASDDEEAVRKLRTRLSTLDAVLLPPETSIINAWSLKPILLMSARAGVPTFGGITEDYVKAGVTATVVLDLDRLHEQILAVTARLAQGIAPPPAYPDAHHVVINETVARALSIKTDPTDR
jgi:ABC-type uncharacterized transport system substrate-binding protein